MKLFENQEAEAQTTLGSFCLVGVLVNYYSKFFFCNCAKYEVMAYNVIRLSVAQRYFQKIFVLTNSIHQSSITPL